MTPYNMGQRPRKQSLLLMPLVYACSFLMTRKFKLRIEKQDWKNRRKICKRRNKEYFGDGNACLIISTHQGFADYYIAPLALFPIRAVYVSDMEGFAAFGKGLYRALGCIGKRRYVPDLSVMENIHYALHNLKQPVVIYPESRHSNIGCTAKLPQNMGKLAKIMNVPIFVLTAHGSYLANPFWDEEHTRKTRMEASLKLLYKKEDLEKLSADEIQHEIERRLQYDEYDWQLSEKIKISYKNRAVGLYHPLYQCKKCGTQYRMKAWKDKIFCEDCGSEFRMNEYGQLLQSDNKVIRIRDWYLWEKENVEKEITQGNYLFHGKVRIEALPNEKGFVSLGDGELTHNKDGFFLSFQNKEISFLHRNMESLQTEYNYRGRGSCIVLSKKDCCYYVYSDEEKFCPTKMQFATEYLSDRVHN